MTQHDHEYDWNLRTMNPFLDDALASSRALVLLAQSLNEAEVHESAAVEPAVLPEPLSLFVPENYEANYPYPLLIWLHADGGNERDVQSIMPQVSTQNMFGMGLRADEPVSGVPRSFRWSMTDESLLDLETRVRTSVLHLRSRYHVHSERIYLAGFGAGATIALQLLLRRPEWFAGAIAHGGASLIGSHPLIRYRELKDKRVLLGTGSENIELPPEEILDRSCLLHSAGMTVATRIYDAGNELTPKMLSDINYWLMEGIGAVV